MAALAALVPLLVLLLVAVPLAAGAWAFLDAQRRGLMPATAVGVALIVAFTLPVGLALWLLFRDRAVEALGAA